MTSTQDDLVHICTAGEWLSMRGQADYTPDTFDAVGFVHLSTPEQVHLPANRLFSGRTDLVLLRLDPARLTAPVRWEPGVPTDPQSMLFPHLYGPLTIAAVVAVLDYRPGPDGTFGVPRI
ncbi:DUF952 domain-containing protein [Rhodococcus sp. EXRC-4A-4]|uniref:DUF952 domain-containing protein n=1 Tax=Rhodococcus navarretei TaxID=3128981 RepID=A0ABU9CZI4_9NOCA